MHQFGTIYRAVLNAALLCVPLLACSPAFAGEIRIPPGTSAASVNALISKVPAGSRLLFASGSHRFDRTIVIGRDDIELAGASRHETVLRFSLAGSGDFIRVTGGEKDGLAVLAQTAARDSAVIELATKLDVMPGEAIYLYQPNTQTWITENGWTNVSFGEAKDRPFRESIHRVIAVDGNRLTLASAVPFTFAAGEAKVRKISLRKNVSLSDMTITSDLGRAAPNDFANTQIEFSRTAALRAKGAHALRLENVEILNSPSSAIVLQSTIDSRVENIHIDGAHNKGGGGNGYGVELREAFNNRLSGLTIFNMRHAVIFSAWHAETGNRLHVVRTNRDINFHGSVDHSNEMMVDELKLEYATDRSPRKRKNVWRAVSAGGTNHAETDFLTANDVTFSNATGSWREDSLIASATGATLDGGFGSDMLRGNRGDDMIIGGTRADIMTGGGGRDTYILRPGDGADTITDFTTGPEGDIIVFEGLASIDELAFRKSGSAVSIHYGKDSVRLENIDLDDLQSGNFIFRPSLGQT